MFTFWNPFRKRSREDESNDCMPLSKRINNLHLTNSHGQTNGEEYSNNSRISDPGTSSSGPGVVPQPQHHQHMAHNGEAPILMPNGSYKQPMNRDTREPVLNGHSHYQSLPDLTESSSSPHNAAHGTRFYDPELTQNENPHYFHRNKLLYELHFIRSRKCHSEDD